MSARRRAENQALRRKCKRTAVRASRTQETKFSIIASDAAQLITHAKNSASRIVLASLASCGKAFVPATFSRNACTRSTSTSPVDVLGVGINATDTVIRLPQFPTFDSKVEISSAEVKAGGQVASAMVACQRWGLARALHGEDRRRCRRANFKWRRCAAKESRRIGSTPPNC